MVLHTLFSSDRNLGAPSYPRALPELPSPPRLGKHIFEATVHRFGQHHSQSAFRPLESGDLVHAIIADLGGRTSIEGHHRYPSTINRTAWSTHFIVA